MRIMEEIENIKIKKVEIIREKLINAIEKYVEYRNCHSILADLNERYDYILETYDFTSWEGISGGTIRDKAANMIEVTEEVFMDLISNAEKELFGVLQEIIKCDIEEQKLLWNKNLFLKKSDITEEKLKDYLWEWEDYAYAQCKSENWDIFIAIIEDMAKDKNDSIDG